MNEAAWCYLEGFGCKKDKVIAIRSVTARVVWGTDATKSAAPWSAKLAALVATGWAGGWAATELASEATPLAGPTSKNTNPTLILDYL
jgi:hypothetical protein